MDLCNAWLYNQHTRTPTDQMTRRKSHVIVMFLELKIPLVFNSAILRMRKTNGSGSDGVK